MTAEWAVFADDVRRALVRLDRRRGPIALLWAPGAGDECQVEIRRVDTGSPTGWCVTVAGAAVPAGRRKYFPVDEAGRWTSPSGWTRNEVARAAAALLSHHVEDVAAVRECVSWPSGRPTGVSEAVERDVFELLRLDPDERGPQRPPRPRPRLVRTPHEAERVAAEWMEWMGFTRPQVTPVGADEGIDVHADEAIAQVKMEGVPTGRPVIQNAYGVAAAEEKRALVFSLGGYVKTAVAWADRVDVPLFRFDLQGVPEPVDEAARRLFEG